MIKRNVRCGSHLAKAGPPLALAFALAGCGPQGTDGEELQQVTSALVAHIGNSTPSVLPISLPGEHSGGDRHSVSMRTAHLQPGASGSIDAVVNYERNLDPSTNVVTWTHTGFDMQTYLRPSRFWNTKLSPPQFTNILVSSSLSTVRDTNLGQAVYPGVPANVYPSGPPVNRVLASSIANGDVATFALFSDGILRQSYFPFNAWNDFPMSTSAGPTPNGAPQAIQRSADTDSVWYACGTGAKFCEVRLTPPNGNNGFVGPGMGAPTVDFGVGSFAPYTRPTAFAGVGGDGSRWVFAVVDNGTARSIIAKRDNNALSAAVPDYSKVAQTFTIDSGTTTNVTFSTVMPYVNTDGKTAVVYFRTPTGGSALVYELVWNGTAFVPSSNCNGFSNGQIHDTGVVMGNYFGTMEPVPGVAQTAAASGAPMQNSILYRLPTPDGGYQDTVELRAKKIGTSFCYAKASVPTNSDYSGLYIAKASDSKLYRVDASSAVSTALLNTWSGVTSFTTDRLGLGYIVQNNGLWQVNLQDGGRTPLATGSTWTGATQLAFGFDTASGFPTLWAFQGGSLYKVDLAAGTRAALTSASCPAWTGVTAMAYLNYNGTAERLFAVNSGSLYRINSDTGACTALGTTGEWTYTNVMTGDPSSNMLYIDRGPNASSSHRINAVFPTTGVSLQTTSAISAVTAMTALNGSVYAIKAGILYRLTPLTMHLSALSSAVWTGGVFMAPRTWQSTQPGSNQQICDRDPSHSFHYGEACYGQNFVDNPSAFNTIPWTQYRATAVPAATTAPDTTSTGTLLREDATRNQHAIYQDGILASSTAAYDWTVYVKMKASNRSGVMLQLGSTGDPGSYAWVRADLSTGTLYSGSATGNATYIGGLVRAVSNGWYQISVSGIPTSVETGTIFGQVNILPTAGSSTTYTGDGSSGIYLGGSRIGL